MGKYPKISVRLGAVLLLALRTYAQQHGMSLGEVVRDALSAYLQTNSRPDAPTHRNG